MEVLTFSVGDRVVNSVDGRHGTVSSAQPLMILPVNQHFSEGVPDPTVWRHVDAVTLLSRAHWFKVGQLVRRKTDGRVGYVVSVAGDQGEFVHLLWLDGGERIRPSFGCQPNMNTLWLTHSDELEDYGEADEDAASADADV